MMRRFGLLMGIGKMRDPLTCSLLNVFCFLIVIPIYLLVLSDSHADFHGHQVGDEVVAQNKGPGGKVIVRAMSDIAAKIEDRVPNGARGTVVSGPEPGDGYLWYEINWEDYEDGWSAETVDGCRVIGTAEEADQRDVIVEALFRGFDHEDTNHDYNGYGCLESWYPNGGHAGWDAQTKDVAGTATKDRPFNSLTAGTVIRAGNQVLHANGTVSEKGNTYGTIAVYSPAQGSHPAMTTLYLHARNTLVFVGQEVTVGTCLGIQGNVGLWPPTDPDDFETYNTEKLRKSYSEHVHVEIKSGWDSTSASGANRTEDLMPILYESVISGVGRPLAKEADVNQDGDVDIKDLELFVLNIRENNLKFDVNGDGTVNVHDFFAIVEVLFNQACAALVPEAPAISARDKIATVQIREGQVSIENVAAFRETLQQLLNMAHEIDDGTLTFKHGIAMLQNLLVTGVPEKTTLLANYPNPFNPETWIPYCLATDTDVTITIYDAAGNMVRHLDAGHQKAGYYTSRNRAAYWNGRSETGERVASGVYFYTLTTDKTAATRKMVILK